MTVVRPALDSVRDSARVLMMTTLSESQKERFRALIERNQGIADSTAKADISRSGGSSSRRIDTPIGYSENDAPCSTRATISSA